MRLWNSLLGNPSFSSRTLTPVKNLEGPLEVSKIVFKSEISVSLARVIDLGIRIHEKEDKIRAAWIFQNSETRHIFNV